MLLMLISCGSEVIYDQEIKIDNEWKYVDSLEFSYNITDTIPSYDIMLTVEHSPDFGYENLYVNATTQFPDGNRNTHPFSLQFVGEDGHWAGKCSKNVCKVTLPISVGVYFPQIGNYKIVIEQFSRIDSLQGVSSMNLKITKAK